MKNICVFCGASKGNRSVFMSLAYDTGKLLAKRGYQLIYGGGNVGLMGAVADGSLKFGGRVTGVIPKFLLDLEVGHKSLTELIIVDSMHERKQKMALMADAFIALPGGFGTLEELAEIITWKQLKIHSKPIGVINVESYYDPLIAQIDLMEGEGFISSEVRSLLMSDITPEGLISQFEATKEIVGSLKNIDRT